MSQLGLELGQEVGCSHVNNGGKTLYSLVEGVVITFVFGLGQPLLFAPTITLPSPEHEVRSK